MNWEHLLLKFPNSVKLTFPFHPVNGLPLMFLDDGRGHVAGFLSSDHALFSDHHKILTSIADETNQNLNGPQKELLLWHHKLGHINFDWLQALARHGRNNPNAKRVFESKFSSIGNCHAPSCAACQWEKGSAVLPVQRRSSTSMQ